MLSFRGIYPQIECQECLTLANRPNLSNMLSFKSSRMLDAMIERLSNRKRSLQLATPLLDSPSLSRHTTINYKCNFNHSQQENSQSKSKGKAGCHINRHRRIRSTWKHINSLLASTTKPRLQLPRSCRARRLQKNNEPNHLRKASLVQHPTRSTLQQLWESFKSSWASSPNVSTRRWALQASIWSGR